MEHYDIVIIGAGPAGLAAAFSAADKRKQVLLIDDNPRSGGQIWRHYKLHQLPKSARKWIDKIENSSQVTHLSQTKVVMFPAPKQILLETPDTAKVVAYDKLILATGARELFLPYPGWDLPNVTGAGGLQAQIKSGLSLKGQKVVIAGSGPLLLAAAASARKAGADVIAIAEQTSFNHVAKFALQLVRWPIKAMQSLGLIPKRYWTDSYVESVQEKDGKLVVTINRSGNLEPFTCDRLACGFGLMGNVELPLALGCQVEQSKVVVDSFQRTSVPDCYAVGELTGIGGSELALVEGQIAGYHACGEMDDMVDLFKRREHWRNFAKLLSNTFALSSSVKQLATDNTLICRCEDVTFEKVKQYSNMRDAKVATRCGMGACQGRICSGVTQTLFQWQPMVPRPPFSPARVSTIAKVGLKID